MVPKAKLRNYNKKKIDYQNDMKKNITQKALCFQNDKEINQGKEKDSTFERIYDESKFMACKQ